MSDPSTTRERPTVGPIYLERERKGLIGIN